MGIKNTFLLQIFALSKVSNYAEVANLATFARILAISLAKQIFSFDYILINTKRDNF